MINTYLSPIAEWAWGTSPSPDISPDYCTSTLPLLPAPCINVLLVKLIGIAMMVGATLNKAPIFFNVLNTRSSAGLSLGSVYGEVIMYSNSVFYGILRGNPFTSWGENGIMTIQSLGIVILMWKFQDKPPFTTGQKLQAMIVYGAYVLASFILLSEDYYYLLLSANWPALVVARGAQIWDTFKMKHTGNHSLITTGMNFLGSAIRIFTTIKEIGWDLPLLSGYILSVALNIVLILQFFLYWDATVKFKKSLKEKKKA